MEDLIKHIEQNHNKIIFITWFEKLRKYYSSYYIIQINSLLVSILLVDINTIQVKVRIHLLQCKDKMKKYIMVIGFNKHVCLPQTRGIHNTIENLHPHKLRHYTLNCERIL